VPDLCTVNVDVRLTPALDDLAVVALLRGAAARTDAAWPETPPTDVDVTTLWPPFALPDGSPLRDALLDAAAWAGLAPAAKVAGPSNIGNYLAGLGIPATRGIRRGLPGPARTNERIRLDSIPVVQAAYHQALLTLLRAPSPAATVLLTAGQQQSDDNRRPGRALVTCAPRGDGCRVSHYRAEMSTMHARCIQGGPRRRVCLAPQPPVLLSGLCYAFTGEHQ
jgi:hypothetical protein